MRKTLCAFGLSMIVLLTAIVWIGVVVFCRNDPKFCGGCCEPGIVIASAWVVLAPLCLIAALVGTLAADRSRWARLLFLYGGVIAILAALALFVDWSILLVGLVYVLATSFFLLVARRYGDVRESDQPKST
jgi:hypothetical protein